METEIIYLTQNRASKHRHWYLLYEQGMLEHLASLHDTHYRRLNVQLAVFIDGSVCLLDILTSPSA